MAHAFGFLTSLFVHVHGRLHARFTETILVG